MAWNNVEKPSSSFNQVVKPSIFNFLLLENGAFLLNEASGYYELGNNYRNISKPNATWSLINKPN